MQLIVVCIYQCMSSMEEEIFWKLAPSRLQVPPPPFVPPILSLISASPAVRTTWPPQNHQHHQQLRRDPPTTTTELFRVPLDQLWQIKAHKHLIGVYSFFLWYNINSFGTCLLPQTQPEFKKTISGATKTTLFLLLCEAAENIIQTKLVHLLVSTGSLSPLQLNLSATVRA